MQIRLVHSCQMNPTELLTAATFEGDRSGHCTPLHCPRTTIYFLLIFNRCTLKYCFLSRNLSKSRMVVRCVANNRSKFISKLEIMTNNGRRKIEDRWFDEETTPCLLSIVDIFQFVKLSRKLAHHFSKYKIDFPANIDQWSSNRTEWLGVRIGEFFEIENPRRTTRFHDGWRRGLERRRQIRGHERGRKIMIIKRVITGRKLEWLRVITRQRERNRPERTLADTAVDPS